MSQCISICKYTHVWVYTQLSNANLKSSCFRFIARMLHSSELGEALGKEQ